MQEEVEKEEEEEEELRKIVVFSRRRRRRRVVIETVRVWIRASNFFFDFNQFLLGFFQINVETDVVSTVLVAECALRSGYFLFRGLFQAEKVVL